MAAQHQFALDRQLIGLAPEARDGDRIAADVMEPAERGGWAYDEPCAQDAQVKAVARAKHQTVRAEPHWRRIGVARDVPDLNVHGSLSPQRPPHPTKKPPLGR
jgi:hypothetical protein